MELNEKVTQLEDEIKILKNEVQAVLLDIRESYLDRENPFLLDARPMISQPVVINQQAGQPTPMHNDELPEKMTPEDLEPDIGVKHVEDGLLEPDEDELLEPGEDGVEELVSEPELVYEGEEEPFSEMVPTDEQELTAFDEKANEEVKRVWRSEIDTESHLEPRQTTGNHDGKIDLTTIARLAQWVSETVKRLGHERTEVVLDISEMMGHIAPELKSIVAKFIAPVPDEYTGNVTTRDYLASLVELNNLLGRENKSEVALLYILCQENDHR